MSYQNPSLPDSLPVKSTLTSLFKMPWSHIRRHVRGLHTLHHWVADGILYTNHDTMRALIGECLLIATHLSYFESERIASDWGLDTDSMLSAIAEDP